MKRWTIFWILACMTIASTVTADGLLIPSNDAYPGDLMKNRVTEVSVTIRGLIAETVVYQEFKNEWTQATDAVWAFPLPQDARATSLMYSYGEKTYQADLQEKEQVENPGTGEGGIIAEINEYLGDNVLRLSLQNIRADEIQKIELHYISLLDYHRGEYTYRYPLDTESFISYPLEHLEFNVDLETTRTITGYAIPSHPDYEVLTDNTDHLVLRMRQPKAYISADLVFTYQVDNQELGVDFFTTWNPFYNDGYFNLLVRPVDDAHISETFSKKVVFLLNNSSNMIGYKLEQSVAAISQSLDSLKTTDEFNIVTFNSSVTKWRNSFVPVTESNIESAREYLDAVTGGSGSRIDLALRNCLTMFSSEDNSNAIIMFTDGRSPLDPEQIADENNFDVGIFPVGIGDDIDRSKLEMVATLNHGFATYFDEDDNLLEGMVQVFEKVSMPLIKDVTLSFNKADITDLEPIHFPSVFAGSYFYLTGRYSAEGTGKATLRGDGVNGPVEYDFELDFTDNTSDTFAERFWAKEQIDTMEREISVYGETPSLQDEVTTLSLNHGIRCRYTSYVAEYTQGNEVATGVDQTDEETSGPATYLAGNYPNPFNPVTTIQLYIDSDSSGQVKLLKVYNVLGQLVAVIDLTHLSAGWHSIQFNAVDYKGMALSSGVYFAQLQAGSKVMNVIRMQVMK